ncbi:MAG: hypothetical protein ABWK01_06755, partial [Infirmifilum sp.]
MEVSDETERATFYAFEGVLSTIYSSAIGIAAGYLADIAMPRTLFLVSSIAALLSTLAVQKLLPETPGDRLSYLFSSPREGWNSRQ